MRSGPRVRVPQGRAGRWQPESRRSDPLQEGVSSMVVEQPGVSYVAGEDLHRLMAADLLNFSDVRSGARGRRDEARAEAVARITSGSSPPASARVWPMRATAWSESWASRTRPPFHNRRKIAPSTIEAAASQLRTWSRGLAGGLPARPPCRPRPPGRSWSGGWPRGRPLAPRRGRPRRGQPVSTFLSSSSASLCDFSAGVDFPLTPLAGPVHRRH